MKTTEYLDACKEKLSLTSDYQLAKVLELRPSAISAYRNSGGTFGRETAKKVAKILGIHPVRVRADAEFERAKSPEERALWRELVGKLVAVAGGVGLAIALYPAEVAAAVRSAACVLCKITRRTFRRLTAAGAPPPTAPAALLSPA